MDQISLTPASSDDFEDLLALRIAAMRPSLERLGRFDPERARERFRSGFSQAHTRHILMAGKRIGFVVVKPQEDGLLLDHLYIDPDFQGQGVGAAVLNQVFAEADAQNQPLRVGALRDSDANRFYLRHGFHKTGESEWDIYYERRAS